MAGGSGCGRRREPIHGGLAAASMPRTLPQPDPPAFDSFPRSVGARVGSRCCATGSAPIWNSRSDRCVDQGRHLPTTARSNSRRYPQPREPVRGGAVWACRTVGAMDGAIESPGMRALCLRSTASRARTPSRQRLGRTAEFTACAASPHRPANPRNARCCCCRPAAARGAGPQACRTLHSATCSTCRGSGLVSGSCQKIIVEVRVIAPTHRNVACSAAVALLLSR